MLVIQINRTAEALLQPEWLMAESWVLYEPLVNKLAVVESLTDAEVRSAIDLCTKTQLIPRRTDVISDGEAPKRVHLILRGWAARY